MPGHYNLFLKDIQKSLRPAEMIVYDQTTIPKRVLDQLQILIRQHGGRPDPQHVLASSSASVFLFDKMKDANAALDKMEILYPTINADISYAPT